MTRHPGESVSFREVLSGEEPEAALLPGEECAGAQHPILLITCAKAKACSKPAVCTRPLRVTTLPQGQGVRGATRRAVVHPLRRTRTGRAGRAGWRPTSATCRTHHRTSLVSGWERVLALGSNCSRPATWPAGWWRCMRVRSTSRRCLVRWPTRCGRRKAVAGAHPRSVACLVRRSTRRRAPANGRPSSSVMSTSGSRSWGTSRSHDCFRAGRLERVVLDARGLYSWWIDVGAQEISADWGSRSSRA